MSVEDLARVWEGGDGERYAFDEFIGAREAARGFSGLVEALVAGRKRRYVILHRNRPRAVLLSIDEYERLIAGDERSTDGRSDG